MESLMDFFYLHSNDGNSLKNSFLKKKSNIYEYKYY